MADRPASLLKLLREDARSWWYFKKLRQYGFPEHVAEAAKLERQSVRKNIAYAREAKARYGYLQIMEGHARYLFVLGQYTVVSGHGYPAHLVRLCEHLDVPVFDMAAIPGGDRLIWDEPVNADHRLAYYVRHKEKANG